MRSILTLLFVFSFMLAHARADDAVSSDAGSPTRSPTKKLKVLFIGIIFTSRHQLAEVVMRLAESGDSYLEFDYDKVIYG